MSAVYVVFWLLALYHTFLHPRPPRAARTPDEAPMNPTKHSPLARRIVVHAALNNKALRDGLSNYDLLRLCIEMNAMDLRTAKRAAPAGPPTRQRRRVVQYKGGAVR